jgi:SsrA-binding protein
VAAVAAGEKTAVSNRRARKDYDIIDTYEAGLVLMGTEVKALRAGNANLKDSYAALKNNELWLHNLYIGPYPPAGPHGQHEPERVRKLLLNRNEIDRLIGKVIEKGLTLVPLRIYFKTGRAKLELAVARGRKQHDKREIKKKEATDREIVQALRRRR